LGNSLREIIAALILRLDRSSIRPVRDPKFVTWMRIRTGCGRFAAGGVHALDVGDARENAMAVMIDCLEEQPRIASGSGELARCKTAPWTKPFFVFPVGPHSACPTASPSRL